MGFLWVAGPTFVYCLCAKRRIALFFFFEKSIEYIKSASGRNPWYTGSIQRGLGERGEIREKIRKTNHLWGQPPLSPSEESKEKQMEEFLIGSRFVLKTPIITLPPDAPHNAKWNHFPNNRTPCTATRPPACIQVLNSARHDPAETKPGEESIPQSHHNEGEDDQQTPHPIHKANICSPPPSPSS
jgi:hypothetical protein